MAKIFGHQNQIAHLRTIIEQQQRALRHQQKILRQQQQVNDTLAKQVALLSNVLANQQQSQQLTEEENRVLQGQLTDLLSRKKRWWK